MALPVDTPLQVIWMSRVRTALNFIVTAILFTGCADLGAIRKFADAAADSAQYTALSSDYPKSIERQKRYQPTNQQQTLDSILKTRQSQQPGLLALHKGIANYMRALGDLAADDLVSYDKSLDGVTDNLKTTKLVSSVEADAFGSITKLIAKASTDAYRQSELRKLINDANSDFQTVINAMVRIVGTDFVASLDNDSIALKGHYKNIIEVARHNGPQDASIELLNEQLLDKLALIEIQKEACVGYAETLRTIGAGHQSLFDNRSHISSKVVLTTIQGYADQVKDAYEKIKALK